MRLAGRVTLPLRDAAEGRPSDIVIVPSLFVREDGWAPGRYPGIARWIVERHAAGAAICSACSGPF